MRRLRAVLVLVCAQRELSTVLILPFLRLFCTAIYAAHESPTLRPRIIVNAQ